MVRCCFCATVATGYCTCTDTPPPLLLPSCSFSARRCFRRYSDGEEEELHGGRGSWTIIKTLDDPEDVILVEGRPKAAPVPSTANRVTCKAARKQGGDGATAVLVTFDEEVKKWGEAVLDTLAGALDLEGATRVWVRYSDGEEEELHGGRGSWNIIKSLEPDDVILVEGTPKRIGAEEGARAAKAKVDAEKAAAVQTALKRADANAAAATKAASDKAAEIRKKALAKAKAAALIAKIQAVEEAHALQDTHRLSELEARAEPALPGWTMGVSVTNNVVYYTCAATGDVVRTYAEMAAKVQAKAVVKARAAKMTTTDAVNMLEFAIGRLKDGGPAGGSGDEDDDYDNEEFTELLAPPESKVEAKAEIHADVSSELEANAQVEALEAAAAAAAAAAPLPAPGIGTESSSAPPPTGTGSASSPPPALQFNNMKRLMDLAEIQRTACRATTSPIEDLEFHILSCAGFGTDSLPTKAAKEAASALAAFAANKTDPLLARAAVAAGALAVADACSEGWGDDPATISESVQCDSLMESGLCTPYVEPSSFYDNMDVAKDVVSPTNDRGRPYHVIDSMLASGQIENIGDAWLHPVTLSPQKVEEMCAGEPNGTFMVYKHKPEGVGRGTQMDAASESLLLASMNAGSDADAFVLTVVHQNKPTEYMITKDDFGFYTMVQHGNTAQYANVPTAANVKELINPLRSPVAGWPVVLAHPIVYVPALWKTKVVKGFEEMEAHIEHIFPALTAVVTTLISKPVDAIQDGKGAAMRVLLSNTTECCVAFQASWQEKYRGVNHSSPDELKRTASKQRLNLSRVADLLHHANPLLYSAGIEASERLEREEKAQLINIARKQQEAIAMLREKRREIKDSAAKKHGGADDKAKKLLERERLAERTAVYKKTRKMITKGTSSTTISGSPILRYCTNETSEETRRSYGITLNEFGLQNLTYAPTDEQYEFLADDIMERIRIEKPEQFEGTSERDHFFYLEARLEAHKQTMAHIYVPQTYHPHEFRSGSRMRSPTNLQQYRQFHLGDMEMWKADLTKFKPSRNPQTKSGHLNGVVAKHIILQQFDGYTETWPEALKTERKLPTWPDMLTGFTDVCYSLDLEMKKFLRSVAKGRKTIATPFGGTVTQSHGNKANIMPVLAKMKVARFTKLMWETVFSLKGEGLESTAENIRKVMASGRVIVTSHAHRIRKDGKPNNDAEGNLKQIAGMSDEELVEHCMTFTHLVEKYLKEYFSRVFFCKPCEVPDTQHMSADDMMAALRSVTWETDFKPFPDYKLKGTLYTDLLKELDMFYKFGMQPIIEENGAEGVEIDKATAGSGQQPRFLPHIPFIYHSTKNQLFAKVFRLMERSHTFVNSPDHGLGPVELETFKECYTENGKECLSILHGLIAVEEHRGDFTAAYRALHRCQKLVGKMYKRQKGLLDQHQVRNNAKTIASKVSAIHDMARGHVGMVESLLAEGGSLAAEALEQRKAIVKASERTFVETLTAARAQVQKKVADGLSFSEKATRPGGASFAGEREPALDAIPSTASDQKLQNNLLKIKTLQLQLTVETAHKALGNQPKLALPATAPILRLDEFGNPEDEDSPDVVAAWRAKRAFSHARTVKGPLERDTEGKLTAEGLLETAHMEMPGWLHGQVLHGRNKFWSQLVEAKGVPEDGSYIVFETAESPRRYDLCVYDNKAVHTYVLERNRETEAFDANGIAYVPYDVACTVGALLDALVACTARDAATGESTMPDVNDPDHAIWMHTLGSYIDFKLPTYGWATIRPEQESDLQTIITVSAYNDAYNIPPLDVTARMGSVKQRKAYNNYLNINRAMFRTRELWFERNELLLEQAHNETKQLLGDVVMLRDCRADKEIADLHDTVVKVLGGQAIQLVNGVLQESSRSNGPASPSSDDYKLLVQYTSSMCDDVAPLEKQVMDIIERIAHLETNQAKFGPEHQQSLKANSGLALELMEREMDDIKARNLAEDDPMYGINLPLAARAMADVGVLYGKRGKDGSGVGGSGSGNDATACALPVGEAAPSPVQITQGITELGNEASKPTSTLA